MTLPAARSFGARVRGVAAFVAIVWGVALSFVALEIISLTGFEAVRSSAAFGDAVLSPTVTASTSCEIRTDETSVPREPPLTRRDADAGAWLLGLSLGRDAVVRQNAATGERLRQLEAGRQGVAEVLEVPSPPAFSAWRMATANTDFMAFVEDDQGGTAHALAATYSPRTCELFKLGALWGYSEVVRPALPGERAVFAMEIRHHARRAGLPEPLWSPMLQRTPATANAEAIISATETLTNRITAHLKTPVATPDSP